MTRRRIEQSKRTDPTLYSVQGDPQARAWKTQEEAEKRRDVLEVADRIRSGQKGA